MRRMWIIILAAGFLAGCQGTPRYGGGLHADEGDHRPETPPSAETSALPRYAVDPIALGKIIDRYLGLPHAAATQDSTGYDCSAFVGEVYLEYASIHLPRATENLYKAGRVVEKGDLLFGDLVFFDTGGRGVSHVGIYVGFDEFVHASTSNGVVISNMNDKYYGKRYLGARRVVE